MTYIPSHKDQAWLLPQSVEEFIPEDHICFLAESIVDDFDYKAFDIKYSGAGHPAYHPSILLKLLAWKSWTELGLHVGLPGMHTKTLCTYIYPRS